MELKAQLVVVTRIIRDGTQKGTNKPYQSLELKSGADLINALYYPDEVGKMQLRPGDVIVCNLKLNFKTEEVEAKQGGHFTKYSYVCIMGNEIGLVNTLNTSSFTSQKQAGAYMGKQGVKNYQADKEAKRQNYEAQATNDLYNQMMEELDANVQTELDLSDVKSTKHAQLEESEDTVATDMADWIREATGDDDYGKD